MKKIILTKLGGPESLEIQDAEIPEPGDNEIQVKVSKAGVAFAEVEMRHGRYPKAPKLPYTPGYDICGIVTKTGKSVEGFNVGDKVVALIQFGGYAEYAIADANLAVTIPQSADSTEAAALGLNYISAYQMLTKFRGNEKGGSIVVHSAAGGTGTALIQIAKNMGLKIYGTASATKLALLTKLGAIPIDRNKEETIKDLEPEGVDMVLDPIGGEHWHKALKLIKKGGSLVAYGLLSMFDHDKPVGGLYDLGRQILSLKVFNYGRKFHMYNLPWNDKAVHDALQTVVQMYQDGKIKPVIGKVYSLLDAKKAHEDLASGKAQGKLILDCNL